MRKSIYMLAVGIGTVDFAVKGFIDYNRLFPYIQGWSWHLTMFVIYLGFALIIWALNKGGIEQLIGAMVAYSLEDLTYYILKSIATLHVVYNNWLFKSWVAYLMVILVTVITSYKMLGGDNGKNIRY